MQWLLESVPMKRRIRSDLLRAYFDAAWSCLPVQVQQELRGFIRNIDEVESFENVYLYVRGEDTGAIEIYAGPLTADAPGYAAYHHTEKRRFADLVFASKYMLYGGEGYAVAVCLHEIAHAYDHFLNGSESLQRDQYLDEVNTWNQAEKWAKTLTNPLLRSEVLFTSFHAKIEEQFRAQHP